MLHPSAGFTLVELMIVIAIIAIIAAIALPAYQTYVTATSERACLGEAKHYANAVYYALYSPDSHLGTSEPVPAPANQTCQDTTDASAWTQASTRVITAAPLHSSKRVLCDLARGVPCHLTSPSSARQ